MQRFDDDERRRRLGVRHRLAAGTRDDDVVAAAAAVVALHGTDPASTFLAARARTDDFSIERFETALYDERTLIRVLAMRRTVFVVPVGEAPLLLAGASDDVGRTERKKMLGMLAAAGVDASDQWLTEVEQLALDRLAELGEASAPELAASDPRLATPLVVSPGTRYEATQKLASRLLTVLSAEGRVVRARPTGSWTSSQMRWAALDRWSPTAAARVDPLTAEAALARRWLERFGPAHPDDLTWWTRWTKTRTRRALAACGAVEVELAGGTGVALPDDLDPTPDVHPWTALLPPLDPTTMGWKQRDWYLGDLGPHLFDINGNAGPTVWADGRIVGGWAHQPSGEISVRLLVDVGTEAAASIQQQAADLSAFLGDVRLTARSRGYSPLEKDLLARP
ncbi:winged helix DNA-binding domain-containing protein [Aeromicrobium wangtongii]|uniref:winged helix DNA-binding domain-containing protein n=1 Tax=Aeromicrobium wangtongii TaxID=2969247 RepID=UPI002017234B|nr:winged helix DNA-binding domain-containing protein [Aeromicrobium wangtongii]MCL3816890.1 winged helix DNA-binding domain-containing protein [Aeromicrobium wangtongii]